MHCPYCNFNATKVLDSRISSNDQTEIKRRRLCPSCNTRFTTHERPELQLPRVVKNNGQRVAFDINKIKQGMLRALEKRPVSMNQVDEKIKNITKTCLAKGSKEISTESLGKLAMAALRELDHVAYVRFASVHLRFEDLDAFGKVVDQLID